MVQATSVADIQIVGLLLKIRNVHK